VITFFTIPKPFDGSIELIQKNAIISWVKLNPECEIILFGNEKGIDKIAKELHLIHIPSIMLNDYGTPLIDDVFKKAQDCANNNLLCYVNSDIIFLDDFIESVAKINQLNHFLMVGQRWDIIFNEEIIFEKGWEKKLKKMIHDSGTLHQSSGIDYFIFRKGEINNIPPFVVGRPYWDQWMIGNALIKQFQVIDATNSITAIHQNHDYKHVKGSVGITWEGPEADYNIDLIKKDFNLGDIYNSNYVLINNEFKRAPLIRQFIGKIYSMLRKSKHDLLLRLNLN
jgi:hypothetical protein